MPDDGSVRPSSDLPAPSSGSTVKREPATESQLQKAVEAAPDGITWQDIQTAMATYDPFSTQTALLSRLVLGGLDGYGYEVSFGASVSALAGVSFDPAGISVLWITNSDVTADDDGVSVDPVADSPHFFVFGGADASVGASAGASAGVEVTHFYAERFGDRPITRDSFGGPSVSFGGEVGAKVVGGADVGGSYWSSVDYNKPDPHGAATFAWPNAGWEGVSYSITFSAGVGVTFVELSAGQGDHNMSVTEHMNSIVNWVDKALAHGSQPQLEDDLESADEVPSQLTEGYQRDTAGGGIFSWLADVSSGVGEELDQ